MAKPCQSEGHPDWFSCSLVKEWKRIFFPAFCESIGAALRPDVISRHILETLCCANQRATSQTWDSVPGRPGGKLSKMTDSCVLRGAPPAPTLVALNSGERPVYRELARTMKTRVATADRRIFPGRARMQCKLQPVC
jgi:hypothetical protein